MVDADGAQAFGFGDVAAPVFPRSAVKAIQALPLVESGAADRFGLSAQELALACASHSGEPAHVATAAAMLAKAGLDESALACGAHWPTGAEAARALAREGRRAERAAQQLLGQARGVSLPRLRVGAADVRL